MGMPNLFNYATKELSQDAFLRWLFESYQCGNEIIEKLVHHLLEEFAEIDNSAEIDNLYTLAQWHHIDVTVWVRLKNGENHVIAIEDKTLAGLGERQLQRYNNSFQALVEKDGRKYQPKKVFYKTYTATEAESAEVDNADWKKYYFDDIIKLYNGFEHTGSEILDDYLEHIRNIKKCLDNTSLPEKDNKDDDSYRWIGFFNEIKRLVEAKYHKKYDINIFKTSYSYVCFVVKQHGKEGEPYLECRSTQCTDKHFRALLLAYSNKWNSSEQKTFEASVNNLMTSIDDMIKKNDLKYFINNFRTSKKGNTSKQLVCTGQKTRSPKKDYSEKRIHEANNTNEFFEHLEKCLNEYDRIMEHWNYVSPSTETNNANF